jgi:hypothetical protein
MRFIKVRSPRHCGLLVNFASNRSNYWFTNVFIETQFTLRKHLFTELICQSVHFITFKPFLFQVFKEFLLVLLDKAFGTILVLNFQLFVKLSTLQILSIIKSDIRFSSFTKSQQVTFLGQCFLLQVSHQSVLSNDINMNLFSLQDFKSIRRIALFQLVESV